MPLTPCPQCGTAVSPHADACPNCGATLAPVPLAAYPPIPPRPPAEPDRSRWVTAAGWVVLVALGVLVALFLFRKSREADQRAAEQAEMAREQEHLHAVDAWLQDTSANAPPPASAGRPVPTSNRAKRVWAISRILVDRTLRAREIMQRHGAASRRAPAAWITPRYVASARTYPQVRRYMEGRAAAIAEIRTTAAAWMDERTATLARESGIAAEELRNIFPRDFAGMSEEEERQANTMLEMHRHWERVDPRVSYIGENQLSWQSEADMRRTNELLEKLNRNDAAAAQARARRFARDRAAVLRAIE